MKLMRYQAAWFYGMGIPLPTWAQVEPSKPWPGKLDIQSTARDLRDVFTEFCIRFENGSSIRAKRADTGTIGSFRAPEPLQEALDAISGHNAGLSARDALVNLTEAIPAGASLNPNDAAQIFRLLASSFQTRCKIADTPSIFPNSMAIPRFHPDFFPTWPDVQKTR